MAAIQSGDDAGDFSSRQQFSAAILGLSIDWGIMIGAIRPVGYVAGWGLADGMDAAFDWDGD